MKKTLLYLLPLLLFTTCNNSKERSSDEMTLLNAESKIVPLNTTGGYAVNQLTGDTIDPIINSFGDTIKTGVPVTINGNEIHPDSIPIPLTYNVGLPDIIQANNNIRLAGKPKIETITTYPITPDTVNSLLVNSKGETIPTGIPIPIKGKEVPAIYSRPVKADAPRFKDIVSGNFQYLDVNQGMLSSYVRTTFQDSRGYIWFGTAGGLTKYDGTNFVHFTEKEGMKHSTIVLIIEDKKGNLWLGTEEDGLIKFDGQTFIYFTEKEGLSGNTIRSIMEDNEGNIWFGTASGGISKYDGENLTHFTKREGFINDQVIDILQSINGDICFGTHSSGIIKYDGNSFVQLNKKGGLKNQYINSIMEDNKGNLWIATDIGLSKYMLPTNDLPGRLEHYTPQEGLCSEFIDYTFEDSKGNIWISSYFDGINKYDGINFTHFTEKDGLSSDEVSSITEDSNGALWFSTEGGGVTKYKEGSFSHINKESGLKNNFIMAITEDHDGNMWFGTYGDGVLKYDGNTFTNFSNNHGLSNNSVMSILEDSKGNFWFGTQGGGVNKYDGNDFTYFIWEEQIAGYSVISILEDKKGNIWFGTNSGITKYEPAKDDKPEGFTHFKEQDGLNNGYILSIIEDRKGNIWFSNLLGATKYDGKSFTHYTEKEGLNNNRIISIKEDNQGNIWFGTQGSGISVFNGTDFQYLTTKEGLCNDYIFSIEEDENGNIWVSTENGISFIEPDKTLFSNKNKTNAFEAGIHNFSNLDGLTGVDFFHNSVCLDSKNRIWWGSGKNLTMLDINTHSLANKIPQINLNHVAINDQDINYHNLKQQGNLGFTFSHAEPFNNYPIDLELSHDNNHLHFHFSAMEWVAPHKLKYSFKMEGLNNKWSTPTNETSADYRNLSSGKYTFKIRAIGESGEWSKPFEYSFTILPPWWLTWWARVSYGFIIFLVIRGFFHLRTTKLKQRQKELEEEVENATENLRNKNIEIEKQHEELEETHKEITDSIAYAKRIQSAILPPSRVVKEYLKDSFILYKPKDVVAGDFYWIEHKDGKVLFAAADCTGHGVPGAMVSVICNNGLNRSVREHGLTDPGKILDNTREIIIQEFEKSEDEVKDGMDIALCSLVLREPHGATLKYAGAHNPLWIIRNGEILETKANKQPIGKFDNLLPYTTHSFELEKGDTFYIFSDGYPDQFGGDRGKKYKSGNFKKLLLSIQNHSMEKQLELLDEEFETWKGKIEQIDDVCVIGVRI